MQNNRNPATPISAPSVARQGLEDWFAILTSIGDWSLRCLVKCDLSAGFWGASISSISDDSVVVGLNHLDGRAFTPLCKKPTCQDTQEVNGHKAERCGRVSLGVSNVDSDFAACDTTDLCQE